MKRSLILLFTLTMLVAKAQNEEARVNQLHLKKFEWLIKKNYDSLNWLLDESVQYVHSNGWIESKKEIVDDLKSGKLTYHSVQIEKSSVKFYGEGTAIVTGTGQFSGLMSDGTPFQLKLLYTEVYVKTKKQWKLVNRMSAKIS
jgi:hypothetical protein